MNSFLDKTFTVRQVWRWTRRAIYLAIPVYIGTVFVHDWSLKMGGVGFRGSPYYSIIPSECRGSAAFSGATRATQTWAEIVLLKPSTWVYSLPESEKKLGFGMRGVPCMGYDFLMVLHGEDFKHVNKYVNEKGEVVATVTTEVIKPYRQQIPQSDWGSVPTWPELGNPPVNDASLVTFIKSKESLK